MEAFDGIEHSCSCPACNHQYEVDHYDHDDHDGNHCHCDLEENSCLAIASFSTLIKVTCTLALGEGVQGAGTAQNYTFGIFTLKYKYK